MSSVLFVPAVVAPSFWIPALLGVWGQGMPSRGCSGGCCASVVVEAGSSGLTIVLLASLSWCSAAVAAGWGSSGPVDASGAASLACLSIFALMAASR